MIKNPNEPKHLQALNIVFNVTQNLCNLLKSIFKLMVILTEMLHSFVSPKIKMF